MSFNDPFRNYDAWLTTDHMGEAAEVEAERMQDLWEQYVEWRGSELVPYEANESDHADHAIFTAWKALEQALDERCDRLQAEQEASYDAYYTDPMYDGIDLSPTYQGEHGDCSVAVPHSHVGDPQ